MSVTTAKAPAPIVQFREQLTAMTPEFANALPSHIKPEKFQRVVMTVVQLQPDLLNCDRRSLLASCIKCAADGLVPDGREAALVKFGNAVQYMPMFTGIQKRVRNSGEIASLQAQVVYEHDEFVWVQGINSDVVHKPKFPGDRGGPIGAYAIAKFKDGSDPQIEVMDVAAIERVRKVSRASGNGPWVQWWDEMARKTVFRRLSKWLPLDADVDALIRRDDEGGSPTLAEPSGAVLTGEVVPPDEFEQASRGVTHETPTFAPDPEAQQASDLASQFLACATPAEVDALHANEAVKRQLTAWKKAKPELWELVDQAAGSRKAELRAAA